MNCIITYANREAEPCLDFFGKYALFQKHFPKQLWEFYRVYIYPIKPVQFIRKCFRIDFNLPLK